MKKANWKDITELVGLVAIIASLIFLAFEIRQAKNVAISAADMAHSQVVIAMRSLINEHPDVWVKGNSGSELNESETVIFENMVKSWMTQAFNDWHSYDKLGDTYTAEVLKNDFTGFLFRNPGARRVWWEWEVTLNKYRELLNPEGNLFSDYVHGIKSDLEKLDKLAAEEGGE